MGRSQGRSRSSKATRRRGKRSTRSESRREGVRTRSRTRSRAAGLLSPAELVPAAYSARTPLVHGRAITAEEVERIVGREFSPRQFASLCNALAWGAADRHCTSLPSFTERVNAKDGGIDAEWDCESAEGADTAAGLMGPGWNIFQYKQREALSQDRARTVRSLASGLQGALVDVARRAGKR